MLLVNVLFFMLERSSPQSLSPQMLHAGGEREGRRLDGGRGRVPQAEAAARLQRRVSWRLETLLMTQILIWSHSAQRYRPHFLSTIFPACHFDTCCPVSVPFTRGCPDMLFWICSGHSLCAVVSTPLFLITNLFLRFWYCITPFNIGLGLPELYHKCTYY